MVVAAPPPALPPASSPAPVQLIQQAPPPPAEGGGNRTLRRVGVAALVVGAALAVTGGIFAASSWSKYNSSKKGACLTTAEGCAKAADSIDSRNTLSKVFFATGAAAGLAGGALIVLFPVTEPSRSASLSGFGASAAWAF
jgi:hypothetical protein